MSLRRITDNAKIREVMHAHMLHPELQRAPFIVAIFTREHRPGGIVYEGARPMGASTFDSETLYTLTNGDSGYTRPIANVKLSGIEYVELLQ
jgi:hypothetical protein